MCCVCGNPGEEWRESCMNSKVAGRCIVCLGFETICAVPGRFKRQLANGCT